MKEVEVYKLPIATVYQVYQGLFCPKIFWHRSMDGMYSYSKDIHGNTINLHSSALVTPFKQMTYNEFVRKYGSEELKNTNNP
mgnify:CR=1 FL=1